MTMWWMAGEKTQRTISTTSVARMGYRFFRRRALPEPPRVSRPRGVGGMPWYFFSGVRGLVKPPLCGDPLPTL